MLSAALTRALTTPAFVAADFVPTHWDSAEQKAKFANALLTFVAQDFPRSKFHESFYRRLSNTFGHIANYNSAGFYGRFFLTAEDKLEFLEQCVTWPCHGDPTYTYSDVERAVVARLRKARSSRSSVRKSRSSAGDGSSRFFRSSRLATSRSPRRRRPLRSRTCSADPRRRPPRSRRLSRTGIRNQKREGPTSTAARPPQRVGSAGRFAGPDRIPARCAAFAPVPRPRSGVRGFADNLPNQKDQEQRPWNRQSNCASSIPRP